MKRSSSILVFFILFILFQSTHSATLILNATTHAIVSSACPVCTQTSFGSIDILRLCLGIFSTYTCVAGENRWAFLKFPQINFSNGEILTSATVKLFGNSLGATSISAHYCNSSSWTSSINWGTRPCTSGDSLIVSGTVANPIINVTNYALNGILSIYVLIDSQGASYNSSTATNYFPYLQVDYEVYATTSPLTSSVLSTSPLTSASMTSGEMTTSSLSTSPVTSGPITSAALTSNELTTSPLTSSQVSTTELTIPPFTSIAVTTNLPLTSGISAVTSSSNESGAGVNNSNKTTAIIAGVVSGVIVIGIFLFIVILMGVKRRNKKKSNEVELLEERDIQYEPMGVLKRNSESQTSRMELQVALTNTSDEIEYSELQIGEEIGKGAFGVVYKGKWRGAIVAIKQVKDLSKKEISDFISEAVVMKKMKSHPSVVQFLGISNSPESPLCIVTEFLAGGSLFQKLKEKKINDDKKFQIIKSVVSGMLHLTNENIVHRDLAARNVLLTIDLQAKISDFGMSRVVSNSNGATTYSDVGPLKWMAPESVTERIYSEKTDVWAFGILVIEVYTEDQPFPDLDPLQVATKIGMGALSPTIPENAPKIITNVLKKCFERIPSQRPTFAEICTSLD